MTTPTTKALAELSAKGVDVDFIKQTLQFALQRLMEMDVEALCKAAHGEHSEERANSRNGYRERTLETRAGSVSLKIPKLLTGRYFPDFLEPGRTAEKALTVVIQEAYFQSISTRSVDELVKAAGMSGVSKSQVSRLCEEIAQRVQAFPQRPVEGDWPYDPASANDLMAVHRIIRWRKAQLTHRQARPDPPRQVGSDLMK